MSKLTVQQRVLSYSSQRDRVLIVAAFVASVGAGATLPLMNIIFGEQCWKMIAFSYLRSLTSTSTACEDIQHTCHGSIQTLHGYHQ
jgi:hypothetical protein